MPHGCILSFSKYYRCIDKFELSLPLEFDMKVKRICTYHAGDFERLEVHEKDNLIKPHYRRIKVLPKLNPVDTSQIGGYYPLGQWIRFAIVWFIRDIN